MNLGSTDEYRGTNARGNCGEAQAAPEAEKRQRAPIDDFGSERIRADNRADVREGKSVRLQQGTARRVSPDLKSFLRHN